MSDLDPHLQSLGNWFIQFGPGDLIALVALIIAWIAIRQTDKNSKQVARLNALQITQAEADADAAKSANVSADFAKSGRSYHLKIYNRGPSPAFNVNAELLKGAELIVASELAEKLPVVRIEPHAGIHLIAAPHIGSPRKLIIRLTWDDDRKKGNEKTLELAW